MTNKSNHEPEIDTFKEILISARNKSAVLKQDLLIFASSIDISSKIFAFEGVNDKRAYYQWIKKINPKIKYEEYECECKNNVLTLFDSIKNDQTGLQKRTYFFVDKDFDMLNGRELNEKIFMTDKYSIENYLVSPEILDDILKIDFHCNGNVKIRKETYDIFKKSFDEFLESSKEVNFRIYASKLLKIKRINPIDESIDKFCIIHLDKKEKIDHAPSLIIPLESEPAPDKIKELKLKFDNLEPDKDYRGKYILKFFINWLKLLRIDRISDQSIHFKNIPKSKFKISGDISFENLLSKSIGPSGLKDFIGAIH